MAKESDFKGFKSNSIKGTAIGVASSLVKTQILKAALSKNAEFSETPNDISPLGTLVYDSITLGSTIDKSKNNYLNILGEKVSYNPLKFLQVLVDVSMTKNIVSTQIQGAEGTQKQYISKGDYSILISGTISGKYSQGTDTWVSSKGVSPNYFPEDELKTFVAICDAGYQIPIHSIFLNDIYGITHVVITDYNTPQVEGGRNNQSFEINCLSDKGSVLDFTEEQVKDSEKLKNILGV